MHVVEWAEDLLTLVLRALCREIQPAMSLCDCRQVGGDQTTLSLLRRSVDRFTALADKEGILSIPVGHGFPYADVPELSGHVLVVADGGKSVADRMVARIDAEFVAMRGRTASEYLSPDTAIDAALATSGESVVPADSAGNAGGGTDSYSATILRRMVERNVGRAAIGRPGARSPSSSTSIRAWVRVCHCAPETRLTRHPASRSTPQRRSSRSSATLGKASTRHRPRLETARRFESRTSRSY